MAVSGNRKQDNVGYTKTYGLGAYEVLGVNLTYKQLKEFGFYVKDEDEEKDRDFVGERDGSATVLLEFACRGVGENGKLRKFSFYLENKNARNSEEKERALYKFVNDQGRVAWSTSSSEFEGLAGAADVYFTGEDDSLNPRPAKVGEEEFMLFMRNCMAIDFKGGGILKYNIKKFFNGNFKELQEDLTTDYLTNIVVATTIKVKQDDNGVKEVESFYKYAFAPGSYNKVILQKKFWSPEDCDKIRETIANNKGKKGKERKYVTPLEELIAKMSDPEYPCKEVYHLGLSKEYTGEGHIEVMNDTVVHEEEDDNSSQY